MNFVSVRNTENSSRLFVDLRRDEFRVDVAGVQSKSWLQSSVGIVHFSSGGETPNWLYRARESGMLISDVYFHCPSMFLMKQLGTPYQVRVLLVGSPNTEW